MKKILIFIVIFIASITGTNAYTQSQLDAANILAWELIIFDSSADPLGYNLDKNVLRQEIAAVAVWVADIERAPECLERFSDVSARNPNTWICRNVEPLLEAGIVAPNDTFRPEDSITKAEWLWMLVKAACGDNYAFDSLKSWSWQGQLVTYASANAIVDSFTDYNTLATRGWVFEVWVKARNACGKNKNSKQDILSVQNWRLYFGNIILDITQNIGEVRACKKPGDKFVEVRSILWSSNTYIFVSIFSGVCEWWGWEHIYIVDKMEISNVLSLDSYVSKTYGDKVLYQYLWVTDDTIILNIFKYNGEPYLGYKNAIIDSSKSVSDIIAEDLNREFIEKIDINVVGLFADVNNERVASSTDTVLIHYTGTLEDGSEFDSSYNRGQPIEVDIDWGQVISGFGNALIGMKIWEIKNVTLAPVDAYGEYDETKIQEFPLSDLNAQWIISVVWQTVSSLIGELKVLAVTEDTVTLDVNHPLAGKTLIFDLELVDFVD
jgi:FKBP-type peptidyl-prolyl cis-trans isomerase 2